MDTPFQHKVYGFTEMGRVRIVTRELLSQAEKIAFRGVATRYFLRGMIVGLLLGMGLYELIEDVVSWLS